MSATSGIGVHKELATSFTEANANDDIRYIKVSIRDEQLVQDKLIQRKGSFEDDFKLIQAPGILDDRVPCYILARRGPSDWLAISYVPDASNVRDKMLYASTRTSLLKTLGSTLFTEPLLATSTQDLTPEAYAAHQRHLAAPKPMSARELELEAVRAAEVSSASQGANRKINHVGAGVGFKWEEEAVEAIKKLGSNDGVQLVVLGVDTKTEVLSVKSTLDTLSSNIGSSLPSDQACFAFVALSLDSRRDIVFIYSCPSGSKIQERMVYSSGVWSTYLAAKEHLASLTPPVSIATRKIETSDPGEITDDYLKEEIGASSSAPSTSSSTPNPTPAPGAAMFAKPRGPPRRR